MIGEKWKQGTKRKRNCVDKRKCVMMKTAQLQDPIQLDVKDGFFERDQEREESMRRIMNEARRIYVEMAQQGLSIEGFCSAC